MPPIAKLDDTPEMVTKYGFDTQEQPAIITHKKGNLTIGIPREKTFQEHRVALTPESVGLLVHNGNRVLIETGAGKFSHFSDREYSEAGAEICYDAKELYKSDIIIKVTPPMLEEVEMFRENQTIFSPLHLPTMKTKTIQKMMEKKVTAIAYEYLQDEWGVYPVVRSMSEIAGNSVILIASELLSNISGGSGILLGGVSGIPSTRVVVLGAGVVGETAVRAALGLGANVKVFDNSTYKLHRLQNNIGTRIYTSVLSPTLLSQELENADVVIGAIHSKKGRTPIVISESMVMKMKPNAVIIDVSIDQGGCFETSEMTNHDKPTFVKHDVIHYCVPNIASRVSRTASIAMSNILTNLLLQLIQVGGIKSLVKSSKGVRNGAYLFGGNVTNAHFSNMLGEKHIDLDLLFFDEF
jgi:alanine dehydrogenase